MIDELDCMYLCICYGFLNKITYDYIEGKCLFYCICKFMDFMLIPCRHIIRLLLPYENEINQLI